MHSTPLFASSRFGGFCPAWHTDSQKVGRHSPSLVFLHQPFPESPGKAGEQGERRSFQGTPVYDSISLQYRRQEALSGLFCPLYQKGQRDALNWFSGQPLAVRKAVSNLRQAECADLASCLSGELFQKSVTHDFGCNCSTILSLLCCFWRCSTSFWILGR